MSRPSPQGGGHPPPKGGGYGGSSKPESICCVPGPTALNVKYIADAFLLQLHRDEIQCHETEVGNYSVFCAITTPALCDIVQRILANLRTPPHNYSTLGETTPRFCILTQRLLAQKWSSFISKSKYIILLVRLDTATLTTPLLREPFSSSC